MSFDWNQVQPGDVVVWCAPGSKLSRRVLVEAVEAPIRDESRTRFVWGVEITSHYRPRVRRGVRNWSKRRPFLVWTDGVTDTARGGERIAALRTWIDEVRGVAR